MESIKNVINTLKPGMFLASIDIKDPFYSVLIFPTIHLERENLWVFRHAWWLYWCHKLLEPVFASLHELGYESSVYVDDSLVLVQTCQECFDNVLATVSLLQELGFVIHPTKSIFVPTQKITFLGFKIDTLNMTLTLISNKKENIRNIAAVLLLKQSSSIRTLASFLGNIVSSFEAVPNGNLFYRNIEQQKIEALKTSKGNFDINIKQLSSASLSEITWWHKHIMHAKLSIKPTPDIDYVIYTGASESDWGAHDDINSIGGKGKGRGGGLMIKYITT